MSVEAEHMGRSDVTAADRGAQTAAPRRNMGRAMLRYGSVALIIGIIGCAAFFFLSRKDDLPPPRQVREITVVKIIPPPPPPPPPPPQPEQKMIEQPKMVEPEKIKPEKPLDKPKDALPKDAKDEPPPGPLALDAKPQGPGDLFQLAGHPGGSPFGGGGGGGSRWGWYASMVQGQIEAAFHANEKTRNAVMHVEIRLWADSSGRVSRVQLVSSTGNPELDAVIRNTVLGGMQLKEPPPKDMPMPIVTRVTAQRPG